MLLTPTFVKALKSLFAILFGFYLVTLVLQFLGIYGLSGSNPNSFFRIFINQFYQYLVTLAFWLTVYFITRDKRAFQVVMILQTVVFLYLLYSFSGSPNIKEVYNSFSSIRRGVDILSYALFGVLHFRSARGLYLLFAWFIVFGLSSGPWFSSSLSYFNKLLNLMDLERMFTIRIPDEGRYKYIDFLRPFYSQLYVLFDLIIFWFVYTLIKAGKSFDLSLRTIQLHPVISQLTFSLIYWPLRVILFITSFGILSLLAASFQREMNVMIMTSIVAACFSIFVVGSVYRNFLTDYMLSRGRSPGWLYWLLNIPILNFFAWIYTYSLSPRTLVDEEFHAVVRSGEVITSSADPGYQVEQNSTAEPKPAYEGPPVYDLHPLQNDFTGEGRNVGIKVIMIFLLIGMMVMQLTRTSVGIFNPGVRQAEAPILILLITLAITIWFMFDWKSLLPLYFIQCFGILSIAFFQMEESLSPMLGAGLVNMMIYYSLFHFDYLNLIGPPTIEAETTSSPSS